MKMRRKIFLFALAQGLLVIAIAQPATSAPLEFPDASLQDWVPPDYPAAARQAKLDGEVMVEFVAEADGHVSRASVTKSSDEQFNASALAAVQRWVFSPARVDGAAIACGMRVRVVFRQAQVQPTAGPRRPPPGEWPEALPVTPPKLVVAPDPDYPGELLKRSLTGRVELEFSVESDGTASAPRVLAAPHAAFVQEALRALEKYRFEPAHQGPLPVKFAKTQGDMEFGSEGVGPVEVLAANHISMVEAEKFQDAPRPLVLPEPVYPRDRLLAGESGSATVEFTVTEKGAPAEVRLKEASRPEFGLALVAAVDAWRFTATRIVNERAPAKVVVTHKFVPPVDAGEARLVQSLQPGGPGVGGARGLDQKIRPIWRAMPVYPPGLLTEKPGGQAVIEFIIDRDGRARLPRVVSATREEFGWAAATAISQWVFARPMRGGQPVEVKASIPMEFAPPKD